MSRLTLTPAQERELVAWYRNGAEPRPMTLTKYRRMGLLDERGGLNSEGVALAITIALWHATQLKEGGA